MYSSNSTSFSRTLDYDPFGMITFGRSWEVGSNYRYGFNGKESDSETYGEGNIYDYGFRIYNSRIGKFLSLDPLTSSFPWYTPYLFAGNKPIVAIDLDGLEEKIAIIIEKTVEFSSMHSSELEKAGYVIIHAKNGTEALNKIAESQKQTGLATKEMTFLTHGYEGGMIGNTLNSGIYSDQYLQINKESNFLLDKSMEYGMAQSCVPNEPGSYQICGMEGEPLMQNDYATISDFKTYVDDGKIKFDSEATIIIGGCNVGRSEAVQAAIPNANFDGYGYKYFYEELTQINSGLGTRYQNLNFSAELSNALGVSVIGSSCSTQTTINGTNIYDGGSSPVNGSTRSAASWYKYSKDGTEAKQGGNNLKIVR